MRGERSQKQQEQKPRKDFCKKIQCKCIFYIFPKIPDNTQISILYNPRTSFVSNNKNGTLDRKNQSLKKKKNFRVQPETFIHQIPTKTRTWELATSSSHSMIRCQARSSNDRSSGSLAAPPTREISQDTWRIEWGPTGWFSGDRMGPPFYRPCI